MKIDKPVPNKLNFGDDLNYWLWPKLIPECINDDKDGIHFLGIGTLLKARRIKEKLRHADKVVIFSSGCWGGNLPILGDRCHIYGVRGPRTAKALGLDESMVLGDGAYLLRNLIPLPKTKGASIGFVPHHGSEQNVNWPAICALAGVKFISPRQPVESFLAEIADCKAVIAEAMHGAIASDALRIPWVAACFSPNFREEKWLDWAESMSLELTIHALRMNDQDSLNPVQPFKTTPKRIAAIHSVGPKLKRLFSRSKKSAPTTEMQLSAKLRYIAESAPRQMSSDTAVASTLYRLNHALESLKKDYSSGQI